MSTTENHVVDIRSLELFADSIGSGSEYLVQALPGELYHYTDLNALSSIVYHDDLWLTNSRFTNDEYEMTHGYELAKEFLKKKIRRTRDAGFKAYLKRVESLVEEPPPKGVYICCFCTEDNLLSQWRSYGENGTGVSIGFEQMGFTRYTGADLPVEEIGLMRLWKVFYKRETKEKIIEQALDMIPNLHMQADEEEKARKAADAIHFFIPTFKNSDFEEEKERRLIFTPAPACNVDPRYRVARRMLVPFYSLKELGQSSDDTRVHLPVRSVTVGPSVQKKLNVESVQMLLSQNGYTSVAVTASDTPYRG